jgi:RNA 2',3'-cyclic 3'-phosphodiesterase
LFFALWPDRVLQNALASTAQNIVLASGGRAVPPENLHITLAFLGSVLEARIEEVVAIAADVANEVPREPLRITLDVIEYWKKPKLLCVTNKRAPEGAPGAVLADALKSRLTAAGFAPDLKPFRAHVTLARKAGRSAHAHSMSPMIWDLTDFALVASRTGPSGSVYTVLQTFQFGIPAGAPLVR